MEKWNLPKKCPKQFLKDVFQEGENDPQKWSEM